MNYRVLLAALCVLPVFACPAGAVRRHHGHHLKQRSHIRHGTQHASFSSQAIEDAAWGVSQGRSRAALGLASANDLQPTVAYHPEVSAAMYRASAAARAARKAKPSVVTASARTKKSRASVARTSQKKDALAARQARDELRRQNQLNRQAAIRQQRAYLAAERSFSSALRRRRARQGIFRMRAPTVR